MASSSEIVEVISKCIQNSETNKAASLIEDPQNAGSITSNCWDIMHILCAKLDHDTFEKQPAMFHCCEKLLSKVSELSCPEEALLELLEQAECPEDDCRFLTLLKPMHEVLKRMPEKRQRSLVWCLNLVASHISAIQEPSSYNFQDKERVLLDLDPATRRALDIYESIVPFYESFVLEVSLFSPQESVDKPVLAQRQYQRYVLGAFLIHLLGKPLVCMDLEFDGKTKSKAGHVAEDIVACLSHVLSDIVPILYQRCIASKTVTDDDDWDAQPVRMFLFEEKVPVLGLANLMYLQLAGGLPRHCIPYVYDAKHLFLIGLHLIEELLKESHNIVIWKGLQLAEALLKLVSPEEISLPMLDSPVHKKFCMILEKVVVYCDGEENRKKGIQILQNYVMVMNLKARYQVFLRLFPVLENSGVKGFLVTLVKDTIRNTMLDEGNTEVLLYRGKSLLQLVQVYCVIPNGPEVDLMEHSDHIISILNLLWYLVMADRRDSLGFFCYMSHVDSNFIHPLKDGLKLSRAHYELKIHQLEEERMSQLQNVESKRENTEVSVTVHGVPVPDLSYDEKKQILQVALNKFSLMESLLTNIREAVESRSVSSHSHDIQDG